MKVCSIPGCGKKYLAKGLCNAHYLMFRAHGDPEYRRPVPKCSIPGCEKEYEGKGFCGMHLRRFRNFGDPHIKHTGGRKSKNFVSAAGELCRTCLICKMTLPVSEFYPKRKTDLTASCKLCLCIRTRIRQVLDPESSRAAANKFRLNNLELVRERDRRAKKAAYDKDPKKYNIRGSKWQKNNRPLLNARARTRYLEEPLVKITQNLRARMHNILKIKGATKSARSQDLIGCSSAEIKAHLEFQFVSGMSWENYGPVWHIDHIRPCASFDLLDPEQQKLCFHWTNLQPLFARDNIRKSDKY